MPVIKNGQYADIVELPMKVTHYHKDVLLYDKYYHVIKGRFYVKWKGLMYEVTRSADSVFEFEATGKVVFDEAKPYQYKNRELPLVWKAGTSEIRQLSEKVLTFDNGAGHIVEVWLEGEKLAFSNVISKTKEELMMLRRCVKKLQG